MPSNGTPWEKPPVFAWLQSQGHVDATEMARTLNCGIGMIVITDAVNADKIISHLTSAGEKAAAIGTVVKASGSERVQIDHLEAAWASA